MRYGQIDRVSKPLSRIVLGTLPITTDDLHDSFELLDRFVAEGGTCIETAWNYQQGRSETAVGQWLKRSDVRRRVVIVTKGGQPPNCHPEGIRRQLQQSLERLGLPGIDLYLVHKDDPTVDVGAFIDCLNELVERGWMTAFGASNWSTQRIDEANDYASRHGLASFVAASPHFSLAEWTEPPWDGCIHARDAESFAWYQRTQMPLLAWSSQAHGFFAQPPGGSAGSTTELPHHNRVWLTQGNQRRLERAWHVAHRHNASAMRVALAYVLCQPINAFPIIGPRTDAELLDSLAAVDLPFSSEELDWLDLKRDQLPQDPRSGS